MSVILGIDFGTTNTSASYAIDENPFDLKLGRDRAEMRTVALRSGDRWLVGEEALERHMNQPEVADRLIASFKKQLAVPDRGLTRWRRQEVEGTWFDNMEKGAEMKGGDVRYLLETESLSGNHLPEHVTLANLEEVASQIFFHILFLYQKQNLPPIDYLVIGTPVNFSLAGRQRLRKAALQAARSRRLPLRPENVALVPEPVAVAMTRVGATKEQRSVLVFDHGGGTLDLAVIEVNNPNRNADFVVLGHAGHDKAGSHYDKLLLDRVIHQAGLHGQALLTRLAVTETAQIRHPRLIEEAGRLKESLCARPDKPATFLFTDVGYSFQVEVNPSLLDEVLKGEVEAIKAKINLCLQMAIQRGLATVDGVPQIDEVIMAGGSSLVPAIQKLVKESFPHAEVNTKMAGSRTSTAGLAQVYQRRELIEELTDAEYALFDEAAGEPVILLAAGTPIARTQAGRQVGQDDGFYLVAESERATMILLEHVDERYRPVTMVQVDLPAPQEAVQVMVEIDPVTRDPHVKAYGLDGRELVVETLTVDPAQIPFIEKGQLLAITESDGWYAGSVTQIKRMPEHEHRDFFAGNISNYRLRLAAPDVRAISDHKGAAPKWSRLAIDPPLAGETIELRPPLKPEDFVPLGTVLIDPWERWYPSVAEPSKDATDTTNNAPVDLPPPSGAPMAPAAPRPNPAGPKPLPPTGDPESDRNQIGEAEASVPMFEAIDLSAPPAEIEAQINALLESGYAYGGITPLLMAGGGGAFSLPFVSATRQGLLRLKPARKSTRVIVRILNRLSGGGARISTSSLAAEAATLAATSGGRLVEMIPLQLQSDPQAGLETAGVLCIFVQEVEAQ